MATVMIARNYRTGLQVNIGSPSPQVRNMTHGEQRRVEPPIHMPFGVPPGCEYVRSTPIHRKGQPEEAIIDAIDVYFTAKPVILTNDNGNIPTLGLFSFWASTGRLHEVNLPPGETFVDSFGRNWTGEGMDGVYDRNSATHKPTYFGYTAEGYSFVKSGVLAEPTLIGDLWCAPNFFTRLDDINEDVVIATTLHTDARIDSIICPPGTTVHFANYVSPLIPNGRHISYAYLPSGITIDVEMVPGMESTIPCKEHVGFQRDHKIDPITSQLLSVGPSKLNDFVLAKRSNIHTISMPIGAHFEGLRSTSFQAVLKEGGRVASGSTSFELDRGDTVFETNNRITGILSQNINGIILFPIIPIPPSTRWFGTLEDAGIAQRWGKESAIRGPKFDDQSVRDSLYQTISIEEMTTKPYEALFNALWARPHLTVNDNRLEPSSMAVNGMPLPFPIRLIPAFSGKEIIVKTLVDRNDFYDRVKEKLIAGLGNSTVPILLLANNGIFTVLENRTDFDGAKRGQYVPALSTYTPQGKRLSSTILS